MRWTFAVILLVACEVKPEDTTPRPPAPDRPAPVIATGGCAVALGVQVDGGSITATATNHTSAPVTLELPSRCPGQAAVLRGLPDGYDPDATCTMGACAETPPERWEVAAGATVSIAAWQLPTTGCNEPLDGRFELSIDPAAATIVDGDAAVCAGPAAAVELAAPAPARPKCEPMPACGIGCPGPMAKDANGCTLCACEKDPFAP